MNRRSMLAAMALPLVAPLPAMKAAAMPTAVSVAGVLRNVGAGWSLLNNSTHAPYRFTTVTDMGAYLRVNFDQTFAKVGAVAVSPDEEFARVGYRAGASVGLSYLNLYMYDSAGLPLLPVDVVTPTGNWWLTGVMWKP